MGMLGIHGSRGLLHAARAHARACACAISSCPSSKRTRSSHIPLAIIQALTVDHASKIAINKLPDLGRALIAASDIDYGTTIFTESPLLCFANPLHAETVCYHCLKVFLSTSTIVRSTISGQKFCSDTCLATSERLYHRVEALAASSEDCSLRAFEASCQSRGERYPLMVARLAFARISHAQSKAAGLSNSIDATKSINQSINQQDKPSEPSPGCLVVSGDPLVDVSFLCFANIPEPYPPRWIELYTLLRKALKSAVHLIELQNLNLGITPADPRSPSLLRLEFESMDIDWFVKTLSRLHLNTFRVGCLISDGGLATSGSAAFLLGSLLNHSCEPNIEPVFRRQNATVSFVATRDISKGEALLVSYLDETLPVDQRQRQLEFAYGFKCRCMKCVEDGP